MDSGKTVWEQLEAARVDDAVIGEAYEAAGARSRSLLKTCIAQAHAAYAHILPLQAQESITGYPGITVRRSVRPVDWCLVLLEEQGSFLGAGGYRTGFGHDGAGKRRALFSAPEMEDAEEMDFARRGMLAALSAVFAGVAEVWAVIVESGDKPHGSLPGAMDLVFAGLELAGIENVCRLPEAELSGIFSRLGAEGPGRILIMGAPCWKDAALQCACAQDGIAVWCEGRVSGKMCEEPKSAPGDAAAKCAGAACSTRAAAAAQSAKGTTQPEEMALRSCHEEEEPWQTLWPLLPVSFFREERIECRGWRP